MELVIPKQLPNLINFYPESGNIQCVCGEIFTISSSLEQHGEKLCRKCHLKYKYWNNRDGSGLRFNIKGYFPFYSDEYKFIIKSDDRFMKTNLL